MVNKVDDRKYNFYPHSKHSFLLVILTLVLFDLLISVALYLSNIQLKKRKQVGSLAAVATTSLALYPSVNTVSEGQEFVIDVGLDTRDLSVSAAEVNIEYPAGNLAVSAVEIGNFLPVVLAPFSASQGKIAFTLASQPQSPAKGSSSIATLKMKAIKASASPLSINLSSTTKVAAVNQRGSVTGSLSGSTITIGNSSVTPTGAVTPTTKPGPQEIVVDDKDPGFSTTYTQDAWLTYVKDDPQNYKGIYHHNLQAGTGTDKAIWSFSVPKAGYYQVYAWWWALSSRPTSVPYSVHFGDSTINDMHTTTVKVDQTKNGGQWNALGSYYFKEQGSVSVSDNVSGGEDVDADAIRLVFEKQ